MANKKHKGSKEAKPVEEPEVVVDIAPESGAEAADADEKAQPVQIDLEALRTEVEGILKERDEYLAMLQRVSADFDNYKKRNAQVRLDVQRDTTCDVVGAMLPIFDNLERALQASQGAESDALTKGVDMVVRQFRKAMEDLGVQEIASEPGEAFDPALHNAVVTVPADEDHADNTIFDTLQKGYKMGEKVLRYAMVRVAQDG